MSQAATLQLIEVLTTVNTISAYHRELSDFDLQMRVDLREAYFPTEDFFCEDVTYIHAAPNGSTQTYSAYFEDPTRDVSPKSQVKVTALHPMVQINRFLLAQYPSMSDVIVVRGVRYVIDYIDDDGTGVINIYLVREGRRSN